MDKWTDACVQGGIKDVYVPFGPILLLKVMKYSNFFIQLPGLPLNPDLLPAT